MDGATFVLLSGTPDRRCSPGFGRARAARAAPARRGRLGGRRAEPVSAAAAGAGARQQAVAGLSDPQVVTAAFTTASAAPVAASGTTARTRRGLTRHYPVRQAPPRAGRCARGTTMSTTNDETLHDTHLYDAERHDNQIVAVFEDRAAAERAREIAGQRGRLGRFDAGDRQAGRARGRAGGAAGVATRSWAPSWGCSPRTTITGITPMRSSAGMRCWW